MAHHTPLVDQERKESSRSPQHFLNLVAEKLTAAEELFQRHLASDVPFIHNAGEYIAGGGGKRMRPAVLLLSSRLLGHDGEEEITYAAVIEFIHTASLIHDDIIDRATLRRGSATVNELWGNSRTVLLGDWIYTTAMKMALAHDNLRVIQCLCGATLKMIEGELLTLERLGTVELTAKEYFSIIDRKTAQLFGAACSIPSLIPPEAAKSGDALRRYGLSLGVCFQLVDDLLDFTGTENELGKPVLSDLKGGRLTLPLILLLPRVETAQRKRIQMVLEDHDFNRVAPGEILDLVDSEGTLEEVREMAERSAQDALKELELLPDNDAREALEYAPEFLLHRRS